ncbi:hypothetical protein LOZ12_005160 [Ophidiomyces ophidiicola]|uniref:Uncharacterized protein n=1 Tax=Ophidiomyces ophidiicola TaxID=1387563 RepID=A0ACB8US67_9EURO|nr:uncharacterized protein LOZ57_006710 [Ophidiomyces ophidiicola]KAI1907385.1 hypothetical protein LOZ64_005882 [Ophidiomyces ophidiicola]KAI1936731.1 hypothetical protein LOZ57_006710 [Ophidiomyces ophidiicola]KAI1941639.1 hypothetical protein LOZ62_004703 [Ophidiomyces ophidiicola]KAI1961667.1 hypothetical protein LOZ59_002316 [Ophidiomyces ophidiicola]KAI2001902.1 hypothetical protein LOZ50_005336 [Ophidiomyces ophidiicola]
MSLPSKEAIAAQYHNNSVYVILSSRGALPGFHWGIFIPSSTPYGEVWHATNREGGWKPEKKNSGNVPFSMSLVLAHNVGHLNQESQKTCRDILDSLPADGTPSPNTGEPFDCRTWVLDALVALQNAGVIVLTKPLQELQESLVSDAEVHKDVVERGSGVAKVVNPSPDGN